ncbi:hypothetical protein M426DRAFT_25257 [Hypoxylon sp. CI-4A]|nr:hypothetical protein M426DRAFT_25257 [Hypoxylon sp. CI-4A]
MPAMEMPSPRGRPPPARGNRLKDEQPIKYYLLFALFILRVVIPPFVYAYLLYILFFDMIRFIYVALLPWFVSVFVLIVDGRFQRYKFEHFEADLRDWIISARLDELDERPDEDTESNTDSRKAQGEFIDIKDNSTEGDDTPGDFVLVDDGDCP